MLNHTKLASALEQIAPTLFVDNPMAYTVLKETWQRIVHDPIFLYKARAAQEPWRVPTWSGALDTYVAVEPYQGGYVALSVDGSQIYPDRHAGISCFLINIGTVVIPYGIPAVTLNLESEPYIFSGYQEGTEVLSPIDLVNAQRLSYELQHGLAHARTLRTKLPPDIPVVLLFDGSLIFWHLEGSEAKEQFIYQYLALLEQLHRENILCAWYISMPKSRELMQLIKMALSSFDPLQTELYEIVHQFVDTSLMQLFLPEHAHTTIYKHNGSVSAYYPDHLQPHFVYMHVGDEMSRIEFPAWIARDQALVTVLMRTILDQCIKGQGYPVVLAEAHEQAVVKGPDRDFFYTMLEQISLRYNRRPCQSKKSFKKKHITM
jgi:hypothetical protein